MTHGAIHWVDLVHPDVEKAKAHYGAVLGWAFTEVEGPGEPYTVAQLGDQPIAGLFSGKSIPYPVPPHWLGYVSVDDCAAAVNAVRETGGTVVREPFDVAMVGTTAIVKDGAGAAYGVITPLDEGGGGAG